jgi:AcrR family transcriptional regulator
MATSDRTTDRRRQIIDAALEVFSTKGFHKATNHDIAEAAGGISPGLIYWYFKDKQDLFVSVVQERVAIFQLIEHSNQVMDLPPREGLALIARTYLSIFRTPSHVALFRVLISEVIRFPEIGAMFYRHAGQHFIGLLNHYLDHQVQRGALRPHNTMIAARSFLGMLVVQVIAREVFRQSEAIATSDEDLIGTIVDIFVHGLEP